MTSKESREKKPDAVGSNEKNLRKAGIKDEISRHVGATFNYGDSVSEAIKYTEITPLLLPEDPGDNTGTVTSALFKEEIKESAKETKELKRGVKKAYKITWGQCSKAMQVKLRGDPKYKDFDKQRDTI
eukprot:208592-Ditylum_brightwellii.AAC.1